jgi:hypothetical protein
VRGRSALAVLVVALLLVYAAVWTHEVMPPPGVVGSRAPGQPRPGAQWPAERGPNLGGPVILWYTDEVMEDCDLAELQKDPGFTDSYTCKDFWFRGFVRTFPTAAACQQETLRIVATASEADYCCAEKNPGWFKNDIANCPNPIFMPEHGGPH